MIRLFCLLFCLYLAQPLFSQDLVPYRKNNLWGYASTEGKIQIEPVYEKVYFFKDGLAKVKKDGLIWLIDPKGKLKTANGYNDIFDFHEGRAAACRGGQWDVMQGEIVGGKWGYLDENFQEIIPFTYARAEDFKGDYAIVQKDGNYGNWGVIDKVGRVVLPFNYRTYSFDMRPFPGIIWHDVSNQLQVDVTGNGEKWKIIDLKGKQLVAAKPGYHGVYKKEVNPEYEEYEKDRTKKHESIKNAGNILITNKGSYQYNGRIGRPAKGYYDIEIKNEDGSYSYGLINEKNEEIMPFVFEIIGSQLKDGLLRVEYKGKYGFYDINGKEIIPAKYPYAEDFKNGYAKVFLSRYHYDKNIYGYIDTKGREYFESDPSIEIVNEYTKIKLRDETGNEISLNNAGFTSSEIVDEKYIVLHYKDHHVVYNKSGQVLLDVVRLEMLHNDRVLESKAYLWSLYDLNSKTELEDSLRLEKKGNFWVGIHTKKNRYGAIDGNGKIIFPFTYQEISSNGIYFIVTNDQKQKAIYDSLQQVVKPFSADGISLEKKHILKIYPAGKKYSELYDARTKTTIVSNLTNTVNYDNVLAFETTGKKFGLLDINTGTSTGTIYSGYHTFRTGNLGPDSRITLMKMLKGNGKADIYNAFTGRLVLADVEDVTPALSMLAFKTGEKFRFYSVDGQLLSEGAYDQVMVINDKYVGVKGTGTWNIIDENMWPVLKKDYTGINPSNGNNFIVSSEKGYGLIDRQENTLIPFEYNDITFTGEYVSDSSSMEKRYTYQVEKAGKTALVNDKNQHLTSFIFDAQPAGNLFSGSIATLFVNGKPVLYHYNGTCLIDLQYDVIEPFGMSDHKGNELVRVIKGKKTGLHNQDGKMLLPCEYDKVDESDENYANGLIYFEIEKNGKYGFFCNNGTISIPALYNKLVVGWMDDQAYIKVMFNGHAGLYKNYSHKLTDLEYDDIVLDEENLYSYYIPVKYNGKYGLLDTAGKLMATPQYTKFELQEVSDGYVLKTSKGSKEGIIRLNGKLVLPAEFDQVILQYDFVHTGYLVKKGKLFGFYDNEGKEVLPCEYVKTDDSSDDRYMLVLVDKNGKKTGIAQNFNTGPADE